MKPKTMFYAALGLATFKAGKLFGKRWVREAVGDLREGRKRREARRRD